MDHNPKQVMETLSIKSKKPFSLADLRDTLSKHFPVEPSYTDTLAVHGTGSRAYLYLDSECNDIDLFGLLIDYSDVELVKALLQEIADDPDLTVDNDFGTVLSGSQFVSRCRKEPDWNWRNDI